MTHPAAPYSRVKGALLYRGLVVGQGTALHDALQRLASAKGKDRIKEQDNINSLYEQQKESFEDSYGKGAWERY